LTARSGNPFTIYDLSNASFSPDNQFPRVALTAPFPRHPLSNPVNQGGDSFVVYNAPTPNIVDNSVVNPITGNSDFGPWSPYMTGRDHFNSMGNWNMNLGIYKSFFVTERFKLQFRAEMFNAFNHANLALFDGNTYVYNAGTTNYGPSVFTAEKGPNLSQSGYIPNVSNPARTVQGTLRLDF
jgi:hypothetical protein